MGDASRAGEIEMRDLNATFRLSFFFGARPGPLSFGIEMTTPHLEKVIDTKVGNQRSERCEVPVGI
jgi:hypothetical protein